LHDDAPVERDEDSVIDPHGQEVIEMTTATRDTREEVVATTHEGLRQQALERLKKRRDLKAHILVYGLVNAVLWGVWVVIGTSSGSWWPWPVFVTLFWGIGLVMNGWDVDIRKPITEAELKTEMEHLAGRHE
jgi:hypothetical protein